VVHSCRDTKVFGRYIRAGGPEPTPERLTRLALAANLADAGAESPLECPGGERPKRSALNTSSSQAPSATRRASRRRLTTPDYQALGAFRLALRRFLAFSEAGAHSLGLTPQQHQALLAVRAHTGPTAMSVGELAGCLLIKNHSALGLVERLVERGLLVRSPAAHDRRRVELSLTEAGAQSLEAISRSNLGKLKSTVPVFTDLLQALEQLELPAPLDEAAGPKRKRRPATEG